MKLIEQYLYLVPTTFPLKQQRMMIANELDCLRGGSLIGGCFKYQRANMRWRVYKNINPGIFNYPGINESSSDGSQSTQQDIISGNTAVGVGGVEAAKYMRGYIFLPEIVYKQNRISGKNPFQQYSLYIVSVIRTRLSKLAEINQFVRLYGFYD